MEHIKQLGLSAITGSIASSLDLYIAYKLDSYIGTAKSNFIGLIIDCIVDFIMQQYVFIGKLNITGSLTQKFVISKVITTIASELLFIYLVKHINQLKLRGTDQEKLAELRILINIIVFIVLSYPLRKYWVFSI